MSTESGSAAESRIDFAPMEGITGHVFRSLHASCFGGADAYGIPFISANHTFSFQEKESQDIAPENNKGLRAIPQILTADAEQFLWALRELRALGYREADLNCGCPSGTVCAKGKGAGLLRDLGKLEVFLDAVFSSEEASGMRISVKTRIGFDSAEECVPLMKIYNRFPLSRLVIHPRIRSAMYRGRADLGRFSEMFGIREMPVVYNGDIRTKEDCEEILTRFPGLEGVMIGRGLIRDPALARKIRGGSGASPEELRHFHDALFDGYLSYFRQEKTAVGAMKELWYFWKEVYPEEGRQIKEVQKTVSPAEYRAQTAVFFDRLAQVR